MLAPKDAMKTAYAAAVTLWRDYSPKGRDIARKRAQTDLFLNDFARSATTGLVGNVLVDGMWDNPNFWLRFSLLRAALGFALGRETGLLGRYRQRQCRDSFARLGIREVHAFAQLPVSGRAADLARKLAASARDSTDVLAWILPHRVNPALIYDGILKRQRLAALDIGHPRFVSDLTEALQAIEQSNFILDKVRPELLVISHPFNFPYGLLAWLALSRGIPVVLAFGLFGVLRFARFSKPEDLFRFYDRPVRAEMDALPPARAEAMAEVGRRYLAERMAGRADDLASVFAFQRRPGQIDREELCRRFGWDASRPIVAFYASNWFDWPHQFGMTAFRDFLDWTLATVAVAGATTRVNWLFKPHPAEDWFGGVSLADILARLPGASHIAVADKHWNNTAVMHAVDALVTYHGTAGVEFAALGKPVLVPERGKYDDCGFVKAARSRDEYLALLAEDWWVGIDLADSKRRAEIFAGWWFCAPDWQDRFLLADDSRQDALYDIIPGLIAENRGTVARELDELRQWWTSGHPFYHTSKMMRADRFRITNSGLAA